MGTFINVKLTYQILDKVFSDIDKYFQLKKLILNNFKHNIYSAPSLQAVIVY